MAAYTETRGGITYVYPGGVGQSIPTAPSVMKGLTNVNLAGQTYSIPQAFIDRMMHDANHAYRNVGGAPDRQTLLDMIYRPATQGQYVDYGISESWMKQMQNKYGGQGTMNPVRQQQDSYWQKYAQAPQNRQVKVNLTGQVLSDTGNRNDFKRQAQAMDTAVSRAERKQRSDLMRDYQNFQNMNQTRVMSNLPVKITKL